MDAENNQLIESDEEVYEVEELVGHRHPLNSKVLTFWQKHIEYLIKWKDYADEYNSWENEDNIFSEELIQRYWSRQNCTLEEFRSKANRKKPKLSNTKFKPSPDAVMLEIERKQKLNDIKAATITAEPPAGLTWSDVDYINNLFHCGTSTYFVEVTWNKPDTISFVPTRLLRKHCPLKLIHFYEGLIDFQNLWADKYKPKTLDQLSYHKDLSNHLKKLAHSDNFPHMLFYGPSGAGKKTRITAVLREIYGPSVDKLKVDQRQFISTSNRKMLFTVVSSNFHLELNPSDLGMYDRVIVQDVIKSIAQSQQIDPNARHQFKAKPMLVVVIIDQADELTREAQAALRRTMEKYTSTMRLILCCNSLSRIIAPVRSRCLLMRVGRPEVPEIVRVLQDVSSKEGFELPSKLASKIADHAERNLRAAMLSLESTAVKHSDLTTITQPESLDWEMAIARIAGLILEEQSPARLLAVRSHLYDIITKCIQSSIIIKRLAFYLTRNMDEEMKLKVIERAAFHEHRLRLGAKDIFHLEAFAANVMSMYKRHLNQM
ncbi:hypothetical protein MFLAVUS_003985 [Mucor flavus]|uniref:Chromo domain-containing protein n=1 Tax=Mucor flavus TaxID=439312 RepID=A0ABP9YUP5_9FUNG